MIKDTEVTMVKFRKFADGEVIAIFPEIVATHDGSLMSYMHVGQHGACSKNLKLRKASKAEYTPLYNELTNSVGYTLDVIN